MERGERDEADEDDSCRFEDMEEEGEEPISIRLGEYHADDLLTKRGLTALLKCNIRTVQRMVERYELPPSVQFAGRSVWIVGRLKAWITGISEIREAEALRHAKRLNVFKM